MRVANELHRRAADPLKTNEPLCSTQLPQLCNPPRRHPLGDEDITMRVEAGVVRMDEFAVRPLVGMFADFLLANLLAPFGIVAQAGDNFVVEIEQRDSGQQFGNEQSGSRPGPGPAMNCVILSLKMKTLWLLSGIG